MAFDRFVLVATIRTTVRESTNSPVLDASQWRNHGLSSPELKSTKCGGFFSIVADTLFDEINAFTIRLACDTIFLFPF